MDSCLACDLLAGRVSLPGGLIHRTPSWAVEHCVGPLGVGTLIVKPTRHVTGVDELTDQEAAQLGPLLREVSRVVRALTGAEQVYNCLWSHAGGQPGHVHYVVQPVTAEQVAERNAHGPALQVAMFVDERAPDIDDIEVFADRARELFEPAFEIGKMDDQGSATIRAQLIELERQLLHPGASVDVGALLADDFVEVGASGRRWNRAEAQDLVEARRDGGVGPYDLSDVGCRALGGRAHLLTYTITTEQGVTCRASIWDVIEERWQLIYHQGTSTRA